MKISEILNEKIISIDLNPSDKTEAINMMVDLANNSGKIIDLEKVRECIFEREKIVSTGVGKGFAVPHGKTDEISDVVAAFGITKNGIDFDSIDSEPVKFIFLLVGKDSLLNAHIKLLSRISRLMNKEDFRDKLLLAKTPAEILKLFKEEEQNLIDI
ncbi:MAG TPA: PTS sugar transporter subunit IIA [Bacteroidetes bacterium]|nr:PTS sugar transporter subunit IIA [Bacteroidota bacterium]HCN36786.1 PTS sugar transporter subunit IIA [Bacteroidota bacterium]